MVCLSLHWVAKRLENGQTMSATIIGRQAAS
jgi:hypothetical protein